MTPIAQCKLCRSQDVEVARNGDGVMTATCYGCGNTTQDLEHQVDWVAPVLAQEQAE